MAGEIIQVTVTEPTVSVIEATITQPAAQVVDVSLDNPSVTPQSVYDAGALMRAADGESIEDLGAAEERVNTVAATTAARSLDVSLYGVHDCTMDQNCTFSFTNPAPSGKASSFILILRGAFTPTFPASVVWPGGTAPTYATPSMYAFTTVDSGTTWFGGLIGAEYS